MNATVKIAEMRENKGNIFAAKMSAFNGGMENFGTCDFLPRHIVCGVVVSKCAKSRNF